MVIELVKEVLPDEQGGASVETRIDPGTSAAADPKDVILQVLYALLDWYMDLLKGVVEMNSSIRAMDKDVKKVSTENAGDKSPGGGFA